MKTPAYAFWKIVEVGALAGAGYMLLFGLTAAIVFGAFNPIVILWPALSGAIMGVMVAFSVAVPAIGLHLLACRRSYETGRHWLRLGVRWAPLLVLQFLAHGQPIDAAGFTALLLLALASALTAVHYTEGLRRSSLRTDLGVSSLRRPV